MSNTPIKLRKIVIITVIVIAVLLVTAILLSILWSPSWNPQLLSLLLSIAASLIGVFVGIFVAIFIVEKYLENQRRETEKREQLMRGIYLNWWRGWIHGGVSVLTAIVLHLSSLVLHGAPKWRDIMLPHDDQTKVPKNFGDFVVWLMGAKELLETNITEESLTLFEKELDKTTESPTGISRNDLEIVVSYLEICSKGIRNELFLLQPFMDQHFRLASRLVFFASSLELAVRNIKLTLAPMLEETLSSSSFDVGDKGQHLFLSLAKEALKVYRLILTEHEVLAKG